MKILILTLLFLNTLLANTFPIPFSRQIKDSDVIVDGVFVSEYRLASTSNYEASFKVIRSIGLDTVDLQNNYHLKVKYSQDDQVDGEYIDFQNKERVVLFLKKEKSDFILLNHAQSKYSVVRRGRNWVMISEVFPFHPVIGQVDIEKFLVQAENEKRSKFFVSQNVDEKYFSTKKKFGETPFEKPERKRVIASSNYGLREPASQNQMSISWMIFILGVLSFVSQYISRKNIEK